MTVVKVGTDVTVRRLTMESELMASFLAPGDPTASGQHVLAWVHDMFTGQPVQGANITIWQRNGVSLYACLSRLARYPSFLDEGHEVVMTATRAFKN